MKFFVLERFVAQERLQMHSRILYVVTLQLLKYLHINRSVAGSLQDLEIQECSSGPDL